jgi:ssDNA-binding replication factor A large subunit
MDYDHQRPASLSHLELDQRSVTVLGRILSIGVPKIFTRKGDSTKGMIGKLIIYDSTTPAIVTLWDTATSKILDPNLGIKPGDTIKISEAYTKPGLDGKPELNVGEKGRVEKLDESDPNVKKIETIDRFVILPSNVSDGGKFLVIRGKVAGEVRKSSFSRSDGSASTLTSFSMTDELGSGNAMRVVIWNNSSPNFENLREGDIITLLNVRAKISTFQNSTALEIHGDENTCIRESFDETQKWLIERTKEFAPSEGGSSAKEKSATTTPSRPLPFVGRIISKRYNSGDKKYHLLLLDSQKRKISVTASDDAAKNLGENEITTDVVIICKPEAFDQSTLRASCSSANSISKVVSKRPDIPLSSSLVVKVEDLPAEEGAVVSLELICLNDQVSREIQTKEGLVKRSEISVADHTGEVKVFGWRNLSKQLEEFSAGDRILLNAVEVQIFEGRKFLLLKNYSTVEKKPITA